MTSRRRTTSSPPRRLLTRAGLVGLMVFPLLAGCSGPPPWEPSPTAGTPITSASAPGSPDNSPAETASAGDSATPTARNDLATGTASRTLTAGAVQATVKYWTSVPITAWTPTANKPLTVQLSATVPGHSKQSVHLTKVAVAVVATVAGTPVTGTDPLTDTAGVQPGYEVTAPHSYQQVFTIPPVDASADSLTFTITYEMLLQTAPGSEEYERQTASDVLIVALTR